jgi:hypothetical protein
VVPLGYDVDVAALLLTGTTLLLLMGSTADGPGERRSIAIPTGDPTATAAQQSPQRAFEPPLDLAENFREVLDPTSLRVLRGATRLDVIRLKGAPATNEAGQVPPGYEEYGTELARSGAANVAGFSVGYRIDRLPKEALARVKAVLLDKQSYGDAHSTALCGGFAPKVVLRLSNEVKGQQADSVDILLCFNCSELAVLRPGVHSLAVGDTVDIAGTRSTWVKLAKDLLPKDPLVQSYAESQP